MVSNPRPGYWEQYSAVCEDCGGSFYTGLGHIHCYRCGEQRRRWGWLSGVMNSTWPLFISGGYQSNGSHAHI
jgi:hypothetical protein